VLAGDFDMVLAEEFPGAPMPFADVVLVINLLSARAFGEFEF